MPRLPPLDGSEVRSALAPSPNGGGKCYSETAGKPVGTPTCDMVKSYGWVYVWEAQ